MPCSQSPEERERAIERAIGYRKNLNFGATEFISFESPEHRNSFEPQTGGVDMPTSVTQVSSITGSSSGLGILGRLPLELLVEMLADLDVQTTFGFRQVNRQARRVVSGMFEYRAITTYAPTCFLAVLRTGASTWLSLRHIYQTMRKWECEACGNAAVHFYLPTGTRVCERCLRCDHLHDMIHTVQLSTLAVPEGLTTSDVRDMVPVVKTVAGRYGVRHRKYDTLELINLHQAKEAVLEHTGVAIFGPVLRRRWADRDYANQVTMVLPFFDAERQTTYLYLGCKGCAMDYEALLRCCLEDASPSRGSLDKAHEASSRSMIGYSRSTLARHLGDCPSAGKLWEASMEGTVSTDHLVGRAAKHGIYYLEGKRLILNGHLLRGGIVF